MGIEQQIGIAPVPAVTRVLSQFQPEQLACFIEVAIGLLDLAQPSPDEPDFSSRSDGLPGDPGDYEPAGDDEQGTYVEWTSKPAKLRRTAQEMTLGEEDDELAGDETDGVGAEDEECACFATWDRGPGCVASDSGDFDDGY